MWAKKLSKRTSGKKLDFKVKQQQLSSSAAGGGGVICSNKNVNLKQQINVKL
jgi:hypothetical protein